MKYTDRKKTPLKWHRTVLFLFQPLLILSIAWILFCMINELFSLHVSFAWQIFTPFVKAADPTLGISHLGFMFWPVTGTFFATIVFLILSLAVWIGLLKWKNSSRVLWLVYLLMRAAGMIGMTVYLFSQSEAFRALQTFALFDDMSRNLLHVTYALIVMLCLWNLIFFILNFIYYHKRRSLFDRDYVQPQQNASQPASPAETAPVVTKKDEPSEKTPQEKTEEDDAAEKEESLLDAGKPETAGKNENPPEKNDTESEESDSSDSEEKENPPAEENESQPEENTDASVQPSEQGKQTAEVKETSETVSDESQTESQEVKTDLPRRDPNQVFCPYCGAKLGRYDVLYCSHCGRKLS